MSDTNPSPDQGRAVEEHAVRVPDDAMTPTLRRGDVAVYDTRLPQAGQIAVARCNGRILLREFRPDRRGGFALVPRNHRYRIVHSKENAVSILGRVIAHEEWL